MKSSKGEREGEITTDILKKNDRYGMILEINGMNGKMVRINWADPIQKYINPTLKNLKYVMQYDYSTMLNRCPSG